MIQAYVGLPGTGKTLAMVLDVEELLKKKIRVFSNFPVTISHKREKIQSIYLNPIDFIKALKSEDNATFLVDEANIIFSSYAAIKEIDRGMLNRFAQGRKRHLDFFYTSQRFHHSMKRMRDLTNVVIQCRKLTLLGLKFFQHIYYNPVIFDREALFDTPLEQKYILKKRWLMPWQLPHLYKMYDTEFIIQSEQEFSSYHYKQPYKDIEIIKPI